LDDDPSLFVGCSGELCGGGDEDDSFGRFVAGDRISERALLFKLTLTPPFVLARDVDKSVLRAINVTNTLPLKVIDVIFLLFVISFDRTNETKDLQRWMITLQLLLFPIFLQPTCCLVSVRYEFARQSAISQRQSFVFFLAGNITFGRCVMKIGGKIKDPLWWLVVEEKDGER